MAENHRHPNGFLPAEFFYSGNHSPEPEISSRNQQIVSGARYAFPSSPSPASENLPYQLILNSNQYPLVLNNPNPNNLSPNYLQNLPDSSVESQFSCMGLMDPSPMGTQFSPTYTEYDPLYLARTLQFLRIQSAISGQNGFNGIHGMNSLYSNNPSPQNFSNGTVNNSRFPSPIIRPPPRNKNRVESESGSIYRSGLDIGYPLVGRVPRTKNTSNGSGSSGSNGNGNVEQRGVMGSLGGFTGEIYLLTRSQKGCEYLGNKFQEGDPQEIELFYGEVKESIREIMLDKDGSGMIQKFFDVCPEDYVSEILASVFSDERFLIALCLDPNGTHAIQKLLEVTTKEQRNGLVISVIVRITVTLSTNMYGNHVMQKCLRFFSNDEIESILDVIADNCVDIARDKSGCCVMQQCVFHAQRLGKDRLISQIVSNALLLSDDPYGNYVVQFIMQLKMESVNAVIHEQLRGNYLALSMSKFGSNVVENCIRSCSPMDYNTCDSIIRELIRSPPDFLLLAQHPFGNYVIQCALEKAQGNTKRDLTSLVQFYHSFLQSHPHGKRVIDMTRGKKPQRFRNNSQQQPQQQQPRFFIRDPQN